MHILLFGASGRVGSRVLQQARSEGHDVTAFVRDAEEVPPDVPTVVGDVRDVDAVGDAVPGHDAVCSALGPDNDDCVPVLEAGMVNIVEAMEAASVERLVAVGADGILQATPARLRLETQEFPDTMRALANAHYRAFEAVRSSSLAWTLVCPPLMPDGQVTNHYRTATDYLPDGGQSISVGDIATFVYRELVSNDHVGERVGIAY
ncbi:NAD(P)-dependent oxidoreductase [Halomicroarcula sp. GCM10025324]|uniref:NAD(P)-dependent oxidoreductase n=1 Tax=Haloarcula TaxID=2237 RepID=UPI0023E8B174|nr:SDR family oxidoreductase [Halomicroarcula sp. ZS-22-S1]